MVILMQRQMEQRTFTRWAITLRGDLAFMFLVLKNLWGTDKIETIKRCIRLAYFFNITSRYIFRIADQDFMCVLANLCRKFGIRYGIGKVKEPVDVKNIKFDLFESHILSYLRRIFNINSDDWMKPLIFRAIREAFFVQALGIVYSSATILADKGLREDEALEEALDIAKSNGFILVSFPRHYEDLKRKFDVICEDVFREEWNM